MRDERPGTRFSVDVQPTVPEELERLGELADDLLFSWNRRIRSLFYRLDPELWEACGHNPRIFLRRVSQTILETAAEDRDFLMAYRRALSTYDTYHDAPRRSGVEDHLDPENDLVAYFCMEFGLHESLKIYSGGLGVLAGDHCKAASDLGLPFVAVGLLYHQGYFDQTIDGDGNQIDTHTEADFDDLPVKPVRDDEGREVRVTVPMADRDVGLRIWRLTVGRIHIYLLDSDVPENSMADRRITFQLYGGDADMRLHQEIVLGIGGVRALRAMGHDPTVWHVNEGHAALLVLERCRELVADGLDFDAALEEVAAATVFTTHTPVPAGHDVFTTSSIDHELERILEEFDDSARARALGEEAEREGGFDMTTLALRGSRHHNGVSRIHGEVAARMKSHLWPDVPPAENPVGHVTNGIHVLTFLAREWLDHFDGTFGLQWRKELSDVEFWERIESIPDHVFWGIRRSIKTRALRSIRHRATARYRRLGFSPHRIDRLTRRIDPSDTEILTIGFARRFAAYKRADLILEDEERLREIVDDPDRPVVFLFAGKAHPRDEAGKELIRRLHRASLSPAFHGRIVLLEGYDLALARLLVTGADVWLNTPEHPLEASGTSGQKAGINGVLNLSVLDGWWPEGYAGDNGWAISPQESGTQDARRAAEARELYDLLEEEVVPAYYDRPAGEPGRWVRLAKASMRSLIPRFNAERMVLDYAAELYGPAAARGRALARDDHAVARDLGHWKSRIRETWDEVELRRLDDAPRRIGTGETIALRVGVRPGDLGPDDLRVECLLEEDDGDEDATPRRLQLEATSSRDGELVYEAEVEPPAAGLWSYRIRAVPRHEEMSHPLETGFMTWL